MVHSTRPITMVTESVKSHGTRHKDKGGICTMVTESVKSHGTRHEDKGRESHADAKTSPWLLFPSGLSKCVAISALQSGLHQMTGI